MTQDFYDQLAPFYHLLYADWDASGARQARGLTTVLEEFGVSPGAAILDAACGIGTQALGLAKLGYDVTGSDVATRAVERADYATIERRTPDVRPYGERRDGDCRYAAEQSWYWDGDQYDLTLRLTERCGTRPPLVREFHSRYYAVTIATLERLLQRAGFVSVARRDEHFFQPLLVAVNAPLRTGDVPSRFRPR